MKEKVYEYDGRIVCVPEKGGAYVAFPWDVRTEFGQGRVKVHAAFDGMPYDGGVVNMGVKNPDGSVCYIIGIPKAIRTRLGKTDGDTVHAALSKRKDQGAGMKEGCHMWKCPKCRREFKNENQSHYCGDKPKSIDEYILSQDEDKRQDLYLMREILHHALPEAEEHISWSMPTYRKGRNILHFAASKKHIGLYPGPEAVVFFADELRGKYKIDKGTIRIPYGKIDADLITKIAQWCWETGNHA